MKYLKSYKQLNEGLRDKMLPKSKEDIMISIKKTLGIDNDYIQVKLPEPKDVKKIKSLLKLSDEYNIDIKDYEDDNVLVCGDIIDVFYFMKFYLNYALLNKRNSRRFHIDYIKDNIINNVNEGLRDKMKPKTSHEMKKGFNIYKVSEDTHDLSAINNTDLNIDTLYLTTDMDEYYQDFSEYFHKITKNQERKLMEIDDIDFYYFPKLKILNFVNNYYYDDVNKGYFFDEIHIDGLAEHLSNVNENLKK